MTVENHGPRRAVSLTEIRKIVFDVLRELQMDGDANIMARVVDYELKIQDLTQQVKKLKQQAGETASNEEVAKLRAQLEEMTNNYRVLYDYYERLKKENEALRKKVSSSVGSDDNRLQQLQKELQKARAEAERYRKQLNDAKQLLEQTRSIYSATVKELENRVKTLEQQLSQQDNKKK